MSQKRETRPKPTAHDVAREARVSLATVDRVLNKREGVRDATVKRVKFQFRWQAAANIVSR